MKPLLAATGLTLVVCAMGMAQDSTGDRIVVPARNTSHPRVVDCSLISGSIVVKTYGGKDVIVEPGPGRRTPPAPNGMKRIGSSDRGLDVVEEDNVITIRHHLGSGGRLTITVPADTSLRLKSMSGTISADGVHGEVDAHTQSGDITLTGISGTVSADSQNGAIKVTMDRVDAAKPLAFSTMNGIVDLTFPPDFKSSLTVRSANGPVYTDFDVTMGGRTSVSEKNGSSDGKFRLRMDSTIRGTIGGGGVDLTIRTFNGGVYLRKKK